MAKYDVTYSCGHTGEVVLFGRSSERQRKIEWLETQICRDCQREREAVENDEFEADYEGLATLTGSEKQIAYGRTCRRKAIESYEYIIQQYDPEDPKHHEWREHFCNVKSASWWIDIIEMGKRLFSMEKEWQREEHVKPTEDLEPQFDDDFVVVPENADTKDIAEIYDSGDKICVKSPKNNKIIDCVKELGFRWDTARWYLPNNELNGNPADRISECGNALLLAGVPIAIHDADIRQKAIDGTFEPRQWRWIVKDEDGRLRVKWKKDDRDMYYAALRLPKSRIVKYDITVDVKYWEEIRDFASLNGYSISKDAEKALRDAENAEKTAKRVIPIQQQDTPATKDGLKAILESDRDILDDLKDE